MGSPPDPRRVPESFWREVEQEARDASLVAIYLLFIAAGDFHLDAGGAIDAQRRGLDDAARGYAERQAGEVAKRFAAGARRRFDALRRRWEETRPQQGSSEPPPDIGFDLDQELADVLGPKDAARTAETETTSAQTAGGDYGAAATVGVSAADVWTNHPELTRSGPCPRCEALHGKRRSEWASVDSYAASGPPLHDYCACTIDYAGLASSEQA